VSGGPYRSLNLGILTDDEPALVARNRELVAAALQRDSAGFAMGWQVHGAELRSHLEPPAQSGYVQRGELPKSDAQLTTHPEVTPLVLAADCIPLAVGAEGAVAVLHCGWRGVAAGIVPRAVEALGSISRSRPADLRAALGPGIGPCCYEVGEEVFAALEGRGYVSEVRRDRSLDLPLAVRLELERAGLEEARIAAPGLCTSCLGELFFSHRRDAGVTGRQAGLAWLER
jgi:polyphenol oxidase